MMRSATLSIVAILALGLVLTTACGGNVPTSNQPNSKTNNHDHGHGHDDGHGAEFDLGTQQVGPFEVRVAQLGPLMPSHELVFDIQTTPADAAAVRAWFGGSDRTLHTVARGQKEGQNGWHLHLEPLDQLDSAHRLHIEIEAANGQTHHVHFDTRWAGPHDGIVGKLLRNASEAGWIEVKLHDDEGDIEIWLALDRTMKQPLDLPLDTAITIAFAKHAREIRLVPRNRQTNPDESGKPTIRNGQTNYFIFPGDTGADATWLKGDKFRDEIVVTIRTEQGAITSESFPLVPHTHDHDDH